ncbi:ferredoxin [Nocardia sp. NPDC057663]|uniref:ferredoxin n=1 Tax=Nocardia sp. NPDC057663 TaxID=3346201 RepID=UPI0036713DB9
MRIELDRAKCTGLGICESFAPDFFEVDDDGDLIMHKDSVTADELAAVEEAVHSCPTEALRILRESEVARS